MAYYAYNPDAKVGEPHHKLTMRELFDALKNIDQDSGAWDEPIDIMLPGGSFTAYKFSVEDITYDCDGSCQHPQCAATVPFSDLKDFDSATQTYSIPEGFADEGLHFAPTIWLNDK